MIGERSWHGANFETENEHEFGMATISKRKMSVKLARRQFQGGK